MEHSTDGRDPEALTEVSDTLQGDPDDDAAGYSPADRPWVSTGWGTTDREADAGEPLDGRLARELREDADDEGDGLGDSSDTDGELLDDEVGGVRAGRLADAGDDGVVDREDELVAEDEGVDGGAASAEEAAVHVIGER